MKTSISLRLLTVFAVLLVLPKIGYSAYPDGQMTRFLSAKDAESVVSVDGKTSLASLSRPLMLYIWPQWCLSCGSPVAQNVRRSCKDSDIGLPLWFVNEETVSPALQKMVREARAHCSSASEEPLVLLAEPKNGAICLKTVWCGYFPPSAEKEFEDVKRRIRELMQEQ